MIRYVGVDLHKHFAEACVIDRTGKVLERHRVECLRDELTEFARKTLKKTDQVALEATTNTWSVVDLLRPHVKQVVVGNPVKAKAIAEAKIKTDKVDAETLAQLLRCDYLPAVWQPDADTQMRRDLMTHRTALTSRRGRHANRVQAMLSRLMLRPPMKRLWTNAGVAWLESLELHPHDRMLLDSHLRQWRHAGEELERVDRLLVEIARADPRVRLLMTLPGVSHVVAVGLPAALGPIERFKDGSHAASYLGLAPSTRQSGNKRYHGRITKVGNPQARGLLTEACQHVARHPGPLGAFYQRLAKRKPRQAAIMALARKLVTVAHLMLKNDEPYRYAQPMLMARKFTKLERAYRPEESGKPRPARARAAHGLAAVYDEIDLPPTTGPDALAGGERKMLLNKGLMRYVEELYAPRTKKVADSVP
ncbi:IS110 family RNA-guided transposase [Alienimonas californiensis]|uniref:Transposase IS116/IS110/IS902 family protein n=1 Tax=Alienimonas californiensis TaxID=2527989 RepID=A0A517P6T4_9PLAN|nr:IS110 family transposase [Alienimonas californiensis]QDT15073.1 Transposase IS116/IS110/IS902 family protein [Alienimonas californiensis]